MQGILLLIQNTMRYLGKILLLLLILSLPYSALAWIPDVDYIRLNPYTGVWDATLSEATLNTVYLRRDTTNNNSIGSDTEVIYNNGGLLEGESSMTYNNALNTNSAEAPTMGT